MDNISNSVDSLGVRLGDRIYDRWIYSPADSNCRCGSSVKDNRGPTNNVTRSASRKDHL